MTRLFLEKFYFQHLTPIETSPKNKTMLHQYRCRIRGLIAKKYNYDGEARPGANLT